MSTATAPAPQFKRVRSVTLPVLKLEKDKTRYIAVLGAMHKGKKIDDQKDAATIVHALDMVSGEEGVVICPTVMEKELNEGYPGEAYVGRGFEITLTRVSDKRYNIVSLAEVSIPDETQAVVDAMRKQSMASAAQTLATPKGKK